MSGCMSVCGYIRRMSFQYPSPAAPMTSGPSVLIAFCTASGDKLIRNGPPGFAGKRLFNSISRLNTARAVA
jgi:hypothetical protein